MEDVVRTFTTKPETVFGVSFLAVGLDHELLQQTSLFDKSVMEKIKTLSSKWKDFSEKGHLLSKLVVLESRTSFYPK